MRGNPQRYAVGLYRVSTAEQGNSGLGLGAQQASVQAADMTGAHDLMMRIYVAMAQKEQELISERTKAALAAVRASEPAAVGATPPAAGSDARASAAVRQEVADQTGHRLAPEVAAPGAIARGLLKVGAPMELGRRRIAPLSAEFAAQHPAREAYVVLSDAGTASVTLKHRPLGSASHHGFPAAVQAPISLPRKTLT